LKILLYNSVIQTKGEVLMKKTLNALIVLAVLFFVSFSCKKTTVLYPAFTPTFTETVNPNITPTYPPGWIDDCEDGANSGTGNVCDFNGDNPSANVGGYWITFDDNDWTDPYAGAGTAGSTVPAGKSNCGTSYVWPMSATWATRVTITAQKFSMSAPGYPSSPYGGAYCARMTGYVTVNDNATMPASELQTGFKYGFIGMGVQLTTTAGSPTCAKVDISSYTGVKFWAKSTSNGGAGADFKLKLPYVPNTDCDNPITGTLDGFNDYTVMFTATSTWIQFTKPFSDFAQATGWGTIVNKTTVLQNASQIQFQTGDQPAYFKYPNAVDLEVDDIQLYK
jgi:hypothetical protein